MDQHFCADIIRQITSAIEQGKTHFVYWGFNENCIYILSELKKLGILERYTSGVVDSSPLKQNSGVYQYSIRSPEQISQLELDVLVITTDKDKELALREYSNVDTRLPQVILSGTNHFAFQDPEFDQILASCLVKSYANGYENSLIHIFQSIKYLAATKTRGEVAEFGIFKGGTIVFIAKTLEHFGFKETKVFGFDIFEGFPSRRSIFDLYTNPDCEFKDFSAVQSYCESFNIEVIKGDICDTFKIIDGIPLMLSFFDTDNYSPTRVAWDACFQHTVKGGIFAFDHYISEHRFLYTLGERVAAKEMLKDKNVFNLHGTGIFIKL
jgi:O-methyltransferase